MSADRDLYHLFRVYDYKGGELSTSVNLSLEDFVELIAESFHVYYKGEGSDFKGMTYSEISQKLYEDFDFTSEIYAGSEGMVYEAYVTRAYSSQMDELWSDEITTMIIQDICRVEGIPCTEEEDEDENR